MQKSYQTNLTFSGSYCQMLQTFSREIVPDNTSLSVRCELIHWDKSLLTGISVNSTFRQVFDFKMLKVI